MMSFHGTMCMLGEASPDRFHCKFRRCAVPESREVIDGGTVSDSGFVV